MHDAGREIGRAVPFQPGGDGVDRGQRLRPGPVGKFAIAGKLAAPAIDLAAEEIVGPAEIGEAERLMIERAQCGDAVDQGQAHGVAHRGRTGMGHGQLADRIEAIDRLHQVEGDAQHAFVAAIGDQRGMGHIRAGDGAQKPRLTPHGFIAVGAGVRRRATEDIVAAVAGQAQQDILRPPGKRRHVVDRTGAKPLIRHPRRQRLDVDR